MSVQSPNGKVLVVDDDRAMAESVEAVLSSRGYEVEIAEDGDIALDMAEDGGFDLVVTDVRMPLMGGMDLLDELRRLKPKLPVVVMTAFSSADLAIESTKHGAFDYVIKPFQMPEFLDVVAKGVASSRLAGRAVKLGDVSPGVDTIIGRSAAMQSVYKEVGRVATKPIPVLIEGETGTGKELIARAIYQNSDRAKKPFVAVNCAAIPDTLIESGLFGHEKGAFTNAIATRIGRFEQADGGTLFLDEIGDLPWNTQVKLLRVLQQRSIARVGGKEEFPIDVRIICATHRNLMGMIARREFREDLLYRINTVTVRLPPLRERPEDIQELVHYFLNRYAAEFELDVPAVHKDAMKALQGYAWPGNVRQLENVIKKALVDSRGLTIGVDVIRPLVESATDVAMAAEARPGVSGWNDHIADRLRAASEGSIEKALDTLTEDLERELYAQAVVLTFGNQSKIAKLLGVSRLTVREKLDRYALFPKR